jgi:hypothetical protein
MIGKWKTKWMSVLLTVALAVGVLAGSLVAPVEAQAAGKAYGDSLTLNNKIRLDKTKSFTKTGVYKQSSLFKKKKTAKIKYTIACSRKEAGDYYKVTYKVTYKHKSDPKISSFSKIAEDYEWSLTQPDEIFTVFDYQTGLCLEGDNDLDVTVDEGTWKYTYYPWQKWSVSGKEGRYRNVKTLSYTFTVTYPKDCEDVVVGIGFVNHTLVPDSEKDAADNLYWKGKAAYGKTSFYKKGKDTMAYMRLNN